MSDTVSARVPGWVRSLLGLKGWKVKQREIKDEAPLHPTVLERFSLDAVPQCAGRGPYRPEALRNHNLVSHYFVEQD